MDSTTHDVAAWSPLFVLILTVVFIMHITHQYNSPASNRLSNFGCFIVGGIEFVRTLLLCSGGVAVIYLATDLLHRTIVGSPDAKVNVSIPFKITIVIAVHSGLVRVLSWAKESYLASGLGYLEFKNPPNEPVQSREEPIEEPNRARSPTLEPDAPLQEETRNVRRLGRLRNSGRAQS